MAEDFDFYVVHEAVGFCSYFEARKVVVVGSDSGSYIAPAHDEAGYGSYVDARKVGSYFYVDVRSGVDFGSYFEAARKVEEGGSDSGSYIVTAHVLVGYDSYFDHTDAEHDGYGDPHYSDVVNHPSRLQLHHQHQHY